MSTCSSHRPTIPGSSVAPVQFVSKLLKRSVGWAFRSNHCFHAWRPAGPDVTLSHSRVEPRAVAHRVLCRFLPRSAVPDDVTGSRSVTTGAPYARPRTRISYRLQHYAKPIPRAKIVARSIFARLRGQQVDKNHDERASREGIGRNARRQSPGHHRDSDLRVCYAGTRHHDRQCLSAPHPGRHVGVGCRWP